MDDARVPARVPSAPAVVACRALVIANPAARRGRRLAVVAEAALRRAGVAYELVFTERPGHAAELAAEHGAHHDIVFALGGDGTVMEVAGALAGSGRPIGVLPGGTGNLLARALGIPLDLRRAVPLLLGGEVLRIDLGRIDGTRHFAVAAGVGIDAAMVAETPSWMKRRLGVLAYTIIASRASLRVLSGGPRVHARITVDGETIECDAVAVMIANFGAVLDERITFGPGIRSDDGVLDLCVFTPRTVGEGLGVLWRMLRGNFASGPHMLYRPGRRFRIETDPPMLAQADGELLGDRPFEVVVEPLAAHLLVPPRSRPRS